MVALVFAHALPQFARDLEWIDAGSFSPSAFVAGVMSRTVGTAERDRDQPVGSAGDFEVDALTMRRNGPVQATRLIRRTAFGIKTATRT
jgi:hypothetical protein